MNTLDTLRYKSLSLVYMQIFTIEGFDPARLDPKQCAKIPNSIDRQIFDCDASREKPVERYHLPSFPFALELEKPDVHVAGECSVEMSVFFNRTVSVTYRMMIDGKHCTASQPLTTDNLIALAALRVGAEHWNNDENLEEPGSKTPSNINLKISDLSVERFHLDDNGQPLDRPAHLDASLAEIQRRYRLSILAGQPVTQRPAREMHYVYIDVWEDIDNAAGTFKSLDDAGVITAIARDHKQELVGLMSFYPYEWPYREEEAFPDVCGEDVSIDTDDLIHLNQYICIVFGTYGRRGAGAFTDWQRHLEEREHYHVSWPEYLLILEMVLAKKYTIGAVAEAYLAEARRLSSLGRARALIERNAREVIKVTDVLLRLDAVKYSRFISHEIMFKRTAARLDLEREQRALEETMGKVDKSLFNLSEIRKLRHSSMLNVVLGTISAASLFGIFLQRVHVPFIEELGWKEAAGHAGMVIVGITFCILLGCVAGVIAYNLRGRGLKE